MTDNNAFAAFEENWKPFKGKFFLFGLARYDFDDFRTWNDRISASGGAGYEFLKRSWVVMRGSGGLGVNHTWEGFNDTIGEAVFDWALISRSRRASSS